MKKSYLKLLLAGFALFGSMSFMSCSKDDDKDIEQSVTINDLPSQAKTFLSTYFNDISASKIEKETIGNVILYDVELSNGYEVVFNADGEWTEVDAPDGKAIPSGIVPEAVQATLDDQYPGYGVNEINKTGTGYHVELNNMQGGDSIDLTFNMAGEITPA